MSNVLRCAAWMRWTWFVIVLGCSALHATEPESRIVSLTRDVRPILQEHCFGCHQPAKPSGGLVMTDFAALMTGGESGAVIQAGRPAESYLVEQITPVDGVATMPPEDAGRSLNDHERTVIQTWIAQGAIDDSPEVGPKFDATHPPQYSTPPSITTIAYSPQGDRLAVSGSHEVLIYDLIESRLAHRLVGLSERIERVRFSPDGKRLAVAGGLPGRSGEVQIWDVDQKELLVSKTIGADTLYGVSWSPDGNLVAFGCPDYSVRALDARTGEEKLFMLSHADWVLDTSFSRDGQHLVSVGRDMTVKLTRVATQQFLDNVTSITPGELKGGVHAVAPHPVRDEVLVGGSDGVPQIYRLQRETSRQIGDNANLVRRFPAVTGRIWGVAISPDGKKVATCSSLDGHGWVDIFAADYDAEIPETVRRAFSKVASSRSAEEQQAVDEYYGRGVSRLHSLPFPDTAIFAVDFAPDGSQLVAAGANGQVVIIDAASGSILKQFVPVPLAATAQEIASDGKAGTIVAVNRKQAKAADISPLDVKSERVTELFVEPADVVLNDPYEYTQLLVTARLANGRRLDVTRHVSWEVDPTAVEVHDRGMIRPRRDGRYPLKVAIGCQAIEVPVTVQHMTEPIHPDWVRDITPVVSRLGCNAGTCHGAKEGKNGFKLSLRGYDAVFDMRALTEDHMSRRVSVAFPDESLMLLKPIGAVPHQGGVVTDRDSDYYRILRQWIADGARLNSESVKPVRIELLPSNPIVLDSGEQQQFRVVALDANANHRDVTREAFIESGNTDVAVHDDFGLLTAIRRGEAPVLARYEGCYAATTMTVMGDREQFVWREPETWGRIDELVRDKWHRLRIEPSHLCEDAEFLRRVHLDLTGLPPTDARIRDFLADSRSTREKRNAVIDALIGSPEFIDHWTNKWSDLLQVNSRYLGTEGARRFREWLRAQVAENKPYDRFVFEILTAEGSNYDQPAASYFKILRTPAELMENTTHLFLATRFNCNKCHDHPFERWTQDQYYDLGAFFARVKLSADSANSKDQMIPGTDVDAAKPLYEIVQDAEEGEFMHERTGAVATPAFPFMGDFRSVSDAPRRKQMAAWLTSPENDYFALSYVNRLWGYLLGRGIIDPLDDIRAGNPPSNPELLAYLTQEFIDSGFDTRHLIRQICQSRTYQLSVRTNRWNDDDQANFSHAMARRLPAEVLYDTVCAVTGSTPRIPHMEPGTRAEQLFDSRIDLDGGLLANLGRPPRESSCECERSNDVHLGSVMAMLNGPAVAAAIQDPANAIAQLVAERGDDRALIEALFLRILNRRPTAGEIAITLENWSKMESDHEAIVHTSANAEAAWVVKKASLEAARLERIASAAKELSDYEPAHQRKSLELQQAQQIRVTKAEESLKAYREQLPGKAVDWEKGLAISTLWTRWRTLMADVAEASNGITLAKHDDGAILASGPLVYTDLHLQFRLPAIHVTGIGLETLPHDDLPGLGAGLNPDGNFVVTEIQVAWQPEGSETESPLGLDTAKADHNQEGFDVGKAINGYFERDDTAWAVSAAQRKRHLARFRLKEAFKDSAPGTLHVRIYCRYGNGDYPLASFRLYATDSLQPLEEGLPDDVAQILLKPLDNRSPEEVARIIDTYALLDGEYLPKRQALAAERRPLPPDERLLQLQAMLEAAKRPVVDDPTLVRLRADVQMSIQQMSQRRLTAAQDLTWALINNAEFLFNH